MLKQSIYTFLILIICISAASCLASRESDTSKTTSNSEEKKSETKKDIGETKSEDAPENKETSEKKQPKSEDEQKDALLDTPIKEGFEMRCGWYSNPTPGNHWLTDKDGEWIIGVQGGHQAEGDYPPEFTNSQWLATNGFYGYGCACLSVKVDKKEGLVLEVADGKARPLSACQNDPALKQPSE